MILTGISRTSWIESAAQLVILILVFILVVVLAYFAARIAGKYQSNFINKKSNIKIIETYRVTNNKFIQVVKIGDKYAALGIGKEEISFLMELNGESIKEQEPTVIPNVDFKQFIGRFNKDKKHKDVHNLSFGEMLSRHKSENMNNSDNNTFDSDKNDEE